MPVGTVRSRLSRTRTRLRKLATEELATGGKKSYGRMEPAVGIGQQQGSRTIAARSGEETDR